MTHSEIKRFGDLVKAFAEINHPLTDVIIHSLSNPKSADQYSKWLDIYEEELQEVLSVSKKF